MIIFYTNPPTRLPVVAYLTPGGGIEGGEPGGGELEEEEDETGEGRWLNVLTVVVIGTS